MIIMSAWRIHPDTDSDRNIDGHDLFEAFRNEGYISYGINELGDLRHITNVTGILERILRFCPECKRKIYHATQLFTLCQKIQNNDIVITRKNGYFYVGKISSDYHFEEDKVQAHIRYVVWIEDKFKNNILSQNLRSYLNYAPNKFQTILDLSEYSDEFNSILKN